MKKTALFLILTLIFNPLYSVRAQEAAPAAAETPSELMIHDFESGDMLNNLEGDSGAWDNDPIDETAGAEVSLVEVAGPEGKPTTALRIAYDVEAENAIDIPKNGFWTKLKALDARPYDHLEFYVKGDAEAGFTTTFRVEIKKYKDEKKIEKLQGSALIQKVSGEWQKISIPLNTMTGILDFAQPEVWQDPSVGRQNLDELVVVFEERRADVPAGAILLDDIKLVRTGNPGPTAVDFPPRKITQKTPVPLHGVEFAKFLAARLGGYPQQVVVKKEFPADDQAFLMEVARDTWKFFDHIVDQEHHLPLDTIQLGKDAPIAEDGWVGDYTNVTNIGVYLMCLVAGYDLGFISKEEVVKRILATISSLEKMEYHKESGFLYNYYDTTTMERTSYFVSYVDSGWLAAGLYVVKNAFPEEVGPQAAQFLQRGSFKFFYDPVDRQMYHGYYEHFNTYSDYHYGVFFTEPRAISAIAVARGEVPVEHWFYMVRTFPDDYSWQKQSPKNRFVKETLGHKYYGGYYEWNDLQYVPSWGGSGFEALMPEMILMEKEWAPEGLGGNAYTHVQGQIRYALEEMKYPVWGMSPSSKPEGGYSEYGAAPFGSHGYKPGVATPHVTFLALEHAPKEAVANLRKMIELYDIYGEYGFYDAVTVETGLVAYKYLALDQGMSLVALCNYLKDGLIRKHFNAEKFPVDIKPLMTEEKFLDLSQKPEGEDEVLFESVPAKP